jgi:hypothetical protein
VCIDEQLAAAEARAIAAGPDVFVFRRRIDARELLDHLARRNLGSDATHRGG